MLIVLSGMINFSCRKEFVVGDPPRLPPAETFLMNYAGFSNPDDTLATKFFSDSLGYAPSYNNWRNAYNSIFPWDSIDGSSIDIVTTCYQEALKNYPVHLGGHAFGWPCSFIYLSSGYTASLIATWIGGQDFRIEMYIAKPGMYGFGSFRWLEGTVSYNWNRAVWTLYESPNNPVRLFRIEWNKNWDDNTGDIKYTFLKRGNSSLPLNSYIQYKIVSDSTFDAGYVISIYGNKVLIEWNRKNKHGRIIDPLKYNDNGTWHCWSGFLQDKNCEFISIPENEESQNSYFHPVIPAFSLMRQGSLSSPEPSP